MYIGTVKVPSSNGTVQRYVRIVEASRDGDRLKQQTIANLERKLLTVMNNLDEQGVCLPD